MQKNESDLFLKFRWKRNLNRRYFLYRLGVFAYFAFWLSYTSYTIGYRKEGARFFVYFTNWNFILLSILNFIALIGSIPRHNKNSKLISVGRMFQKLNSMVSTGSVMLTLVYWILIYPKEKQPISPRSLNLHGVNAVFAVADIFISSTPWVLTDIFFSIFYASIYGVFTYVHYGLVIHFDCKHYKAIYKVLDYNAEPTKAVNLAFALVFIAVPVAYLFLWSLNRFAANRQLRIEKRLDFIKYTGSHHEV